MRKDPGFTLIEVLVGLAFVSALTAGLAGLVVVAASLTRDGHDDTLSSSLAIQKLEQLRSSIAAGLVMSLSPPNTLDEDVPGFSDRAGGYIRRWRIAMLPADLSSARVLQVRVLAPRHASLSARSDSLARIPGEITLTTIAGR